VPEIREVNMRLLRRALHSMTIASAFLIAGCGSDQPCSLVGLNIAPPTSSVDHLAGSPANSQQFTGSGQVGPGCMGVTAAIRRDVTWSVSNSAVAQISNVNDATYGVATCTAASATPITVTAMLDATKNNGTQVTGTATLTCR